MSDRIRVKTEWLNKCARDLKSIEEYIGDASSTLSSVTLRRDEGGNLKASLSCQLRMTGAKFSGSNAAEDIRQIQRAAAALASATEQFSKGASKAAALFEAAENSAVQLIRGTDLGSDADIYTTEGGSKGTGSGTHKKPDSSKPAKGTDESADGETGTSTETQTDDDIFYVFGIPVAKKGSVLSGTAGGSTSIFGIDLGAKAEGDILGYSIKTKGSGKWKDEDGKTSGEIGVGIEAEGHLAQGTVSGDVGDIHGEMKGTVGSLKVTGTAGATLYKKGKLSPAIQAKAEAEVAALKGSVKVRKGSEGYNVHAEAKGSVGVAKAKAEAGAGMITYEDKQGVQHTELGIQGTVGAEAYVAEGRVSQGITIMGIEIDVGISGKAGGAGASAGGQITTGGVSGKVDLGLGLGAGVDISVDWSKFSPPKLSDFKLPKLF